MPTSISVILWQGVLVALLSLAPTSARVAAAKPTTAPSAFTWRESFYHDSPGTDDAVFLSKQNASKADAVSSSTPEIAVFQLQSLQHDAPAAVQHDHRLQQSIGTRNNVETYQSALRPDIGDRRTVINLAKMTSDAYLADPSVPAWFNLTDGFNRSHSFGWKNSGLRGHVFANDDNSTVVISFKGTSINPRERTRNHDRENDNVLFSCCCAEQRSDPFWYKPVCNCQTDKFVCNTTCLKDECERPDRYYIKATHVVQNILPRYPRAQLWLVGHSLGGAMASLMSMKFQAPAVTFESPPDLLPALKLGLARPNQVFADIHQFGNTADPIYVGKCYGLTSSCAWAGYAFESSCFSGVRHTFDTVKDKGWHMHVLNHRIDTVIQNVLEAYSDFPPGQVDVDCVDCERWKFV